MRRLLLTLASVFILAGCAATPEPAPVPLYAQCDAESDPWQAVYSQADAEVIIEGIVSGSFQGEQQLGGFFLQHPGQPSRVLFVADGTDTTQVSAGQQVRVLGQPGNGSYGPQLEGVTGLAVCASDQEVATRELALPVDFVAQLDQYLGHRVRIEQPMTVIGNYQLARFGTLDIATERLWTPTQVIEPGHLAREYDARNNLRRLVLDDGSQVEYPEQVRYPAPGLDMNNPVRSGDTVTNLEGILVRIGSNYHLQPVTEPQFEQTNPRPEPPQAPSGADLSIVAFNVLNYFNGDGQGGGFPTPRGAETPEEFQRQRARIIAAMSQLNADIYALMEMENDGFGNHSALADLTRGLNEANPFRNYEYVRLDTETVGSDAITQAIIYRADRVTEAGRAAFSLEEPFDQGSRPPVAQTFEHLRSGSKVTVVSNHFKSKGRCPQDPNDPNANRNDGQACWTALRTASSRALLDWVDENPTGIEHRNIVLLGDFNAYAMETPLRTLEDGGYLNAASYFAPDSYSYVFRGQKGSLDHIFLHQTMLDAVEGLEYWHINADEPIAFEYPMGNKTEEQVENWYSPSPYRSSDHDPIILYLNSQALSQE